MKKKSFQIESLVADLLEKYIAPPDYSERLEGIESHGFVILSGDVCDKVDYDKTYKVMFTTSDGTIVLQELTMLEEETRFQLYRVHINEWEDVFVEWVDSDHDRYGRMRYYWDEGYRTYV